MQKSNNIKVIVAILGVWVFMAVGYMQQYYSDQETIRERDVKIAELETELDDTIRVMGESIVKANLIKTLKMQATAYTASPDETDSDPNVTANGTRPLEYMTCAISREHRMLMNRLIWIEGVGIRKITDFTGPRVSNTVDVFMGSKREAREFGRKSVRIVLL